MLGTAWIQRKLLFPSHLIPGPHPHAPVDADQWWLDRGDAKVELWLLPGDGASAARPGPLVVFGHGNGELIGHWPELLARYRRLGVSVLLPEYRGYGRSTGVPSEPALLGDFEAALERALTDPRVDARRIVYHGRSLGGGVVCGLARRRAPAALILESTFTSVRDVARGMRIPGVFIHDTFESLPAVASFAGPILIFHGEQDRLVPVSHGKRLAAENPRARLVLYRAGHNDLPPRGADYWAQIERTLRDADVL